jgi:hypothetical protein
MLGRAAGWCYQGLPPTGVCCVEFGGCRSVDETGNPACPCPLACLARPGEPCEKTGPSPAQGEQS